MNERTAQQLKRYINKWVALSQPDEAVVGSGSTLAQAKQEANNNGCEKPIFLKVLPDAYYIPAV